ncbi:MAG: hypothetical protein ACHP9Y_04885, partial [Gammaproteobacteria bacterium]
TMLFLIQPKLGTIPVISEKYCLTGVPTSGLKSAITKNIELILKDNTGKVYKFGKTGCPPVRVDQKDYREASYELMYVLYRGRNINFVEYLEKYYATKYSQRNLNENVDTESLGTMVSRDGFYAFYIVI